MDIDHEAVIRQYYAAYRDTDKEALRATLTPDMKHLSEFGTHSDRDAMIEQIWPSVGQTWADDLRVFGEAPDFMVRYRVVGGERPSRNMAESLRFEGDRIAEIEVFVGREVE